MAAVRHLLIGVVVLAVVAAWCCAAPTAPEREVRPLAGNALVTTGPSHACAPLPWPSQPATAALSLHCIGARDGGTALVGGLVTEDAQQHSALFLTSDGGASWSAVGPAQCGARPLAVAVGTGQQGWLWALTQAAPTAAPTLLASADGGRTWAEHHLPAELAGIAAARILPGAGAEVLLLVDDGDERELRSADAGRSWTYCSIRPTAVQAQKRLATADAWSWRLVDDRVERRDPVGGVWEPTLAQPGSGYGLQPGLNVVVALAKGELPWG